MSLTMSPVRAGRAVGADVKRSKIHLHAVPDTFQQRISLASKASPLGAMAAGSAVPEGEAAPELESCLPTAGRRLTIHWRPYLFRASYCSLPVQRSHGVAFHGAARNHDMNWKQTS